MNCYYFEKETFTIQYNRTNYAIDGVSDFDIHVLELLYNQQALCIGRTDRVTELIVAGMISIAIESLLI